MIIADRLTVTFSGFGVPTELGETDKVEIKRAAFRAMKDDLNDPNGVEIYADTVDMFIASTNTTYQDIAARMSMLTDEMVELSRMAWEYEPGTELVATQIKRLIDTMVDPSKG